jgi:hypothetical protein
MSLRVGSHSGGPKAASMRRDASRGRDPPGRVVKEITARQSIEETNALPGARRAGRRAPVGGYL